MDLTSDYPFWSICNGLLEVYPPLERDISCDALVIGGGITGALIGFHLAEAGIKTVLIDRRDIGTGSTSASTALLQYEVDVPLRELVKRMPPRDAIRSYQLCREAIDKIGHLTHKLKIDCQFAKRPSLFLAKTKKEIPEFFTEFQLRRQNGFQLEYLEEKAIKKLFPFSRPAALFSQDGGEVDPHQLTHGLISAAQRRGMKVFDRTQGKKFEVNRSGVRVTTDRGCRISARRVVFATGFESMNYVRGEAGHLKCTFALISEPLAKFPDWHRRALIWESGSPYLYLRTTTENRIIVGGEDEEFVNPEKRDSLIQQKAGTIARKFSKLFPDVKLDVAYSWAGTFGETKDGLAYIGKNRGMPHAYFALGYGGNGITYSIIAAEIIRDAILDRRNPDARLFRFDR
ncbi:MAG: FAD-dependent oxidoreductase [Verrucomicrobiota bacterium]